MAFEKYSNFFILFQALLCYNDPESHPYISDKEKKYLEEALGRHNNSQPSSIPWKAIFMSVPLWALVCAQVCITIEMTTSLLWIALCTVLILVSNEGNIFKYIYSAI